MKSRQAKKIVKNQASHVNFSFKDNTAACVRMNRALKFYQNIDLVYIQKKETMKFFADRTQALCDSGFIG